MGILCRFYADFTNLIQCNFTIQTVFFRFQHPRSLVVFCKIYERNNLESWFLILGLQFQQHVCRLQILCHFCNPGSCLDSLRWSTTCHLRFCCCLLDQVIYLKLRKDIIVTSSWAIHQINLFLLKMETFFDTWPFCGNFVNLLSMYQQFFFLSLS